MSAVQPYRIMQSGPSRSFPAGDPFLSSAAAEAEIEIYIGEPLRRNPALAALLVELAHECLAVHVGEEESPETANILGFARYRNGDDPPSNLIELVRRPWTSEAAVAAAAGMFRAAGFDVALCADQAGRIIDRLVRPKYNDALRFLDEGLATAEDMDLTCRLGLGYPDGPIERVLRGGLANHYDATKPLFEIYGTPAYAPARRATVAKQRAARADDEKF